MMLQNNAFRLSSGRIVTVFGGSGFVGRHVVRALAAQGWRVRVAVRRPDLAGYLQPLGGVGQIHAVQANVRYQSSVSAAIAGAEAVVNLVGVLSSRGKQNFDNVHRFGAQAIAQAASKANVPQLVHMSAIGASADSRSSYARSKALGEQAVLDAFPTAVILRPSIIFGPEDEFFNRFAAMARFSPALPLIGGDSLFQPVFVSDVAQAVACAIHGQASSGAVYELGGPDVRSFRELLGYILKVVQRKRLLLPVPFFAARTMASVLQMLPGKLLTVDQVNMLEEDNIVSAQAIAENRTFSGLHLLPTAMDSVVPGYLYRFRKTGQFTRLAVEE
jgi:uncharacterized protein YbjT (DUF2867 family)